ncbi:mCG12521, isoform CRA_a [Mus musculus]|nr:mCG12521, isoform CRA_a [Mus musculus]EDL05280.1 mCG12521, isoform CRA_a [Mus musculus]
MTDKPTREVNLSKGQVFTNKNLACSGDRVQSSCSPCQNVSCKESPTPDGRYPDKQLGLKLLPNLPLPDPTAAHRGGTL